MRDRPASPRRPGRADRLRGYYSRRARLAAALLDAGTDHWQRVGVAPIASEWIYNMTGLTRLAPRREVWRAPALQDWFLFGGCLPRSWRTATKERFFGGSKAAPHHVSPATAGAFHQ